MEWSKLALQITAIARPRRCTVTLAGMISGSGISGEQSSARERPFRPTLRYSQIAELQKAVPDWDKPPASLIR